LTSVCVFCIGGVLLGLAGLLSPQRPHRGRRLWVRTLPAAATVLALTAAGLGWEEHYWLPPLALVVLATVAVGLRQPLCGRVAQAVVNLVGRRSVQGGLLLAACPLLLLGRVAQFERETTPENGMGQWACLADEPPLEKVAALWAATDAGQTVPLFVPAPESRDRPIIDELSFLGRQDLLPRVIRTGPASRDCNCHGWVFRDAGGQIVHSGLVRAATDEGLILIESKWGKLGRFLHMPTDHCYRNSTCTYYRSGRAGHWLRGLDG
jgi:hypothetical protein